MPDITTTVESSEATVKAVRQERPVGVGGEAIARVPYSPSLDRLLDSGVNVLALKGTTRCIRVVQIPLQGGALGKFHCSRPCVGVGGQQLCPEHDKESFMPNQTAPGPKPAVTNSSMIKLTKAELEEMGIKESSAPAGRPSVSIPSPAPFLKKPKGKLKPKPARPKTESVSITLSLDELALDALQTLVMARLAQALDELPATNIAHMKKIVALQEKILKWGNA